LAVFTTRESADMSQYRVKDSSSLVVFVSTKLLMSIVDALAHRPDGVLEAGDIYETVAAKLRKRKRLVMSRRDIVATVESVLKRFDNTAYVRYRSVHPLGS
jgi:transcriptional regulator NrdR family protein